MKKIFVLLTLAVLAAAIPIRAAGPLRGAERLRELVVYPSMNLSFSFGIGFQAGESVLTKNPDPDVQIFWLRKELKEHPDDTDRLLRLGFLLDNQGETNEARGCCQKAEQLCRSRMAARPQDGLVLTELGRTLWQLGEDNAAESAYRRAALVSSNEWRCWTGLGNFLSTERFAAMFPGNMLGQLTPLAPQPEALNYRPSPEALRQAEAASGEASRCFNRAAALAPREPEVFFQRAGFICASNWQSGFFRHFRTGEKIDSAGSVFAFFSPEVCANLRKAGELDDRNYEFIGLAAYFEWVNAMKQANWPTNASMEMLPDDSRRSIRNAMARLDALSRNSDPKLAAGAIENLGVLNFMLEHNDAAALADFKRAAALDPARETSWDLLLASMLASAASAEELVAVCQSHLSHEDSARNHLILAKALAKAGKWNEATAQAEAAGRLETNNIVSPLLVAAIALKQGGQTNHLSVAGASLARANGLLARMLPGNEQRERTREWGLNLIIYYALNDQSDWARNSAQQYLKLFPDSAEAREILRDLGQN